MSPDADRDRGPRARTLLRSLGEGAEADATARAPLLAALGHVLAAPAHEVGALLTALLEVAPDLDSATVLAPGEGGWSRIAAAGFEAAPDALPRDLLEHGAIARSLQEPAGIVAAADALPPGLLPDDTRSALAVAPIDRAGAPVCVALLGRRRDGVPDEASAVLARVAAERVARAVEAAQLARRADQAAGRAVGFRDQVLAIVGHDLRNPLGAIVMSAALLRSRGGLEGWQAKTVDRVRASAMRMGRIIDDLLSYTRTRLGEGIPVRRAPADLGEVARRIVDEQRVAHPQAAIDLHVSGDLTGTWDAARLEQVLSNLLSNAIDHGEEDAPVSVAAEAAGDAVMVRVENRGEMPPGTVEHAFQAFRRGPEETGRKASGLGLGLFIAREIVRRHGGDIQVLSADGRTSVVATLPRG